MTGTGIPNYWIHQHHKKTNGGEDYDVYSVDGDGNYRSLNPMIRVEIGDTITVQQSHYEFDDESEWSEKVIYEVK